MSQSVSQGTNIASPSEAPMKRKRGRPRKDESQASPRASTPSIQGEGSGAPKPIVNIQSKGKDSIEEVNDDDHNNDEMVGQLVTGVLEYAFEAGYFLTVRVGNSDVYMRGVVFKEDCVVPVTPENDIAPNAKMYKRGDFPIPAMKLAPQVPTQVIDNSSLDPTENNGNQQQQKLPSESITQKELQIDQPDDKDQQEKSSDDKEHQEKEQQTKLLVGDEVSEEDPAKVEGLKDSSEPQMDLQKADQVTASLLNEEEIIQCKTVTDENIEDAVTSNATAIDTVLRKDTFIILPETAYPATDSSVVVPTMVEQEFCGTTSGFQISMENADNEDDSPEQPESPSDLDVPMETGQ